jgi:hypothetical protein
MGREIDGHPSSSRCTDRMKCGAVVVNMEGDDMVFARLARQGENMSLIIWRVFHNQGLESPELWSNRTSKEQNRNKKLERR